MYLNKFEKLKTFFVIFIMTIVAWNVISNDSIGEYGAPKTNGVTLEDWYIEYEDSVTRKDENITLNGNLTINCSGILRLTNVILKINSSSAQRYHIWLKPGGSLIMVNTTISANDTNYPYEFIAEGELYMNKCTINDVWGTSGKPKSGIQISSNAIIIESLINGSSGSGLYINESNPIISECTFSNCYRGIYYHGPLPTLNISPLKTEIIINKSLQFMVSNGTPPYAWESTDISIGTINSTGVFTAASIGACFIKVTDNNNKIGKAEIKIVNKTLNFTEIYPLLTLLQVNNTLQYTVLNGTSPYTWSVDDTDVGTIDENGTFTANSTGICTVKLTDENDNTAEATISIEDIAHTSYIGNSKFQNNDIGILMTNSSPIISTTKFVSNGMGIKCNDSSPLMKSCEFSNSDIYDMEIDSNSYPKLNLTIYNWSLMSALDDDNDQMPNYYEIQYGLNTSSSSDFNLDPDSDSLSNLEEFQNGTDPIDEDSDSDGLREDDEFFIWESNPIRFNETLVLNKNLIIENRSLSLSNKYVLVNSTSSNTYNIWVKSDGYLYLESSSINSFDQNYSYKFISEGYTNITKCSVNNLWGESNKQEGGIQLYAYSVINDSIISESSGTGIYIDGCNPIINNNSISNCYYGIFMNDSSSFESTITNNIIENNDYGLVLNNTYPTISVNQFLSNDIGIEFINSNAEVISCELSGSTTYDFKINSGPQPFIKYTNYNYLLISAPDIDNDGMDDWYEVHYGLLPQDPYDSGEHYDQDNFTNLEEFQNGTDPYEPDTDFDGLYDDDEVKNWKTSPLVNDTDGDGLEDDEELSPVQGVYWFEAEDNLHSDGTSIIDTTANDPWPRGNDAAMSNTSSGKIISATYTDLAPGKYQYFVKAKLSKGEATDLTIGYANNGSFYNMTTTIGNDEYYWYKFNSEINLTTSTVTLYAIDEGIEGNISVDKGVFINISDNKSMEVNTTSDSDDKLEFSQGGGNITINLTIPIEGNVRRYVASASMNITGISEETGYGYTYEKEIDDFDFVYSPDIAVANGTIHVVFVRRDYSGNRRVYYSSSTNNGSTWLQNPVLMGPSNINHDYPSIDAQGNNVHVVFMNESYGSSTKNLYYRRNTNGGGSTWSESYTNLTNGTSYTPDIDVDGNNIHVVWYDDRTGQNEIFYKKSPQNGEYWLADTQLTNTSDGRTPPTFPDVAADGADVHVIYVHGRENTSDDSRVWYTSLNNDGRKINNNTRISDHEGWVSVLPGGTQYEVEDITDCISVDGPNIHAVWVDYDNSSGLGNVLYKKSTDNGITWESVINLSNNRNKDSVEPCIAVDGENSLIYVFWIEEDMGIKTVHYRRSADNGNTWGSKTAFTNDYGVDCHGPAAAPDGEGNFHVVWYDTLEYRIYYNYIKNRIPRLPKVDVGNDSTYDFEAQSGENVKYSILDFSEKVNEYIKANENLISNGFINFPIKFNSGSLGMVKLEEIDIELITDISDGKDFDTDGDGKDDKKESSNNLPIFLLSKKESSIKSSPAILQYKKKVGASGIYITNVVCGNEDGYLYCEPSFSWKYDTGSPIYSSPAIANIDPRTKESEIVVCNDKGDLLILNYKGKMKYKKSIGNNKPIRSSPAISDIYNNPLPFDDNFLEIIVGTDNKEIICLTTFFIPHPNWKKIKERIGVLWTFKTKGKIRSSPTISDIDDDGKSEIIIGCNDGYVYCLNHNGNLQWKCKIGNKIKSIAAIDDINKDNKMDIFIGCEEGYLHCIYRNGKKKGIFNLGTDFIRNSPVIANLDSDEELEVIITGRVSSCSIIRALDIDYNKGIYQITKKWKFVTGIDHNNYNPIPSIIAVDLDLSINSKGYPDGNFETIASDGIRIYIVDNKGIELNRYSNYFYPSSPIAADLDRDGCLEISNGEMSKTIVPYMKIVQSNYKCPPSIIKWGMFGGGEKHNGIADNRYAILIEGSKGDYDPYDPLVTFEQNQFRYNILEMARILTIHPKNNGLGYTGHYLQDHIFYVGVHTKDLNFPDMPEIDAKIPENNDLKNPKNNKPDDPRGKSYILSAIKNVTNICDSYDTIIFYYTAHGKWKYENNKQRYLFDSNDCHEPYSTAGDIRKKELSNALDQITCNRLYIILQPCNSGQWINILSNKDNRIIITSERKNEDKASVFDKCNYPSLSNNSKKKVYWVGEKPNGNLSTDNSHPKNDSEEYVKDSYSVWQYRIKYTTATPDLYQIDIYETGPFQGYFYENFEDNGAEFVSGLTEAFYIDRFKKSNYGSNNILDADQYQHTNQIGSYPHFPKIYGNNNDFISVKEAFQFMKLWHLGYRLNKYGDDDPWYDEPAIEYTNLISGQNYILF